MGSPYSQETAEIKLIPSFVLCADILGFSARSKIAIKNQKEVAFLRKIRATLTNAYTRVRDHAEKFDKEYSFDIKVFTDNIVVGYPLSRPNIDHGEPELIDVLNIFSELQISLAIEGYLLRGGIAYGNHYMDKDIVFGGALLEALDQDKSSKPPRIVLAPSALHVIEEHYNWYGHERYMPVYRSLLKDADGAIFLNYLEEVFNYFPEGGIAFDLLDEHKNAITKGLENHRMNNENRIHEKYFWAANYHNYVCQEFLETHSIPQDPDADEMYGSACEEALKLGNYLIDVDEHNSTFSRIRF